MKTVTLRQIKQAYKEFDSFAKFCLQYGTIIIDFRTEHTREVYVTFGSVYGRFETDNDKVETIEYCLTKPAHWEALEQSELNLANQKCVAVGITESNLWVLMSKPCTYNEAIIFKGFQLANETFAVKTEKQVLNHKNVLA